MKEIRDEISVKIYCTSMYQLLLRIFIPNKISE